MLLGMMLLPCVVLACPSGYESQAALAKAARLIIGVKVESVTDSPAPVGREVGLFDRANRMRTWLVCACCYATRSTSGLRRSRKM